MNKPADTHDIRNRENFKVNKARTKRYKKSTIPYLQRRLKAHFEHMSRPRRRHQGPGGGQPRTGGSLEGLQGWAVRANRMAVRGMLMMTLWVK